MGHSDSTPLRDLLATNETIRAPEKEVSVWGDMSYIQPWDDDTTPTVTSRSEDAQATLVASSRRAANTQAPQDLYQRIGYLTRNLHEAIRDLGYEDRLADSRDSLPEARDRLAYIARVTGEAAEKVLNAVDRARSLQEEMAQHALSLQARWATLASYKSEGLATDAGAALVEETREFLVMLPKRTETTNAILTDIMMAQDFHDLTGQVICKVVQLAQTLEGQLVRLLVDANGGEPRKKARAGSFEGPVIGAQSRSDVVADQAGVDELLSSLGF
ncbi:MAG TPA: protein phosphatase CheZ [Burkholderiaceae bacterium]|nr:protein phosphatase CheZ [Burkholderiaceae bacterium]